MANFSVWASEEDILSVKKAAMAMDRSVSWYIMNCHRAFNRKKAEPVVGPVNDKVRSYTKKMQVGKK